MKLLKNIHALFLLLILFFALFASQKLFTPQFYTSHDGEGHVIRMIEFHESLADGQFPVRIAKRLMRGLSYPYFNFNYPLIYYAGEVFHLSGLSFVDSFKALMVVSFITSGVSMYFLSRNYFDNLSAFVTAVFYMIAPYKFLNMYVRGSVAECIGLSLIPLLFLSIEHIVQKKRWSPVFFTIVASTLILTHNLTAMIVLPLGIAYFFIRILALKKKYLLTKNLVTGIIVTILLTSFFWIPVAFETRLTRLSELTGGYEKFFPSLQEVIYSPWGFGFYEQGARPGKMSPQIGLAHLLFSALGMCVLVGWLLKKRIVSDTEKFVIFFVAVSSICLFLTLPLSRFIWELLPPLQMMQFSWRFVGFILLGSSLLVGYLIYKIPSQKLKIALSVIAISFLLYTNRNHIRVNQYVDFTSPFEKSQTYSHSTTVKDEHTPLWAPRIYKDPNQQGDIIPPSAGISKRVIWKSNYHKFELDLQSKADFRDNTSYFPEWIAKVDGRQVPINYREDQFGRLRVDNLSSGKHTVEYFFREPWYRFMGNYITLTTLLGMLIFFIQRKLSKRKN